MVSPYPVRRCIKHMKWSRKIVRTIHISIFDIFDDSRRKNVLLKRIKTSGMHAFLSWQGRMLISHFF